ncbi:MAG: dihydroorotase [Pseudomonadota bacterium]
MRKVVGRRPPKIRVFTNARLLDPSTGMDVFGDILVRDGTIEACGKTVARPPNLRPDQIIDCDGLCLAPGLVDTRVTIGEPGGERRETIKSASNAAAAGGVTSMVMLPGTDPVIDDQALVQFVHQTAAAKSLVRVHAAAALTKGQEGAEIAEFGLLSHAGAVALDEGDTSISSAQVMRRAMTYATDFDALIVGATHDASLGGGVMNAGFNATRLGLTGIPNEAELIPLERDIRLVGMTKAKYHAGAVSTGEALDLLSAARDRKLDVTAGLAIANLTLNENDIGRYRTFFRLMPPLRTEDDRLALVDGIRSGKVDIISSNHNPQDVDTKRLPFAEAADGAVGLETLLAAALRLHHSEDIPLLRILHCLSTGPAARYGLPGGTLAKGAPGDFLIFDPDEPWVLEESALNSRSRNTAYEGARFQGKVARTVVAGRTVFNAKRQS